ncbi:MAG: ATP-binding protein [Steroidobacteraceae bacterium]
MRRKQLKILEDWRNAADRKPLIVRGARQVGKSTLVRLFAAQHQCPLIEVNLERHPQMSAVFDSMSPRTILEQIEALPSMPAVAARSILFLDEIQAVPAAIASLRYFYEERPDLPVIAAGSLMEFALSERRLSMPVGRVRYLHMGPMVFTEFLEALGEHKLRETIQAYEPGAEIGPVAHARLLELLRRYYFVGGMPAAVDAFARTGRLADVTTVHGDIVEAYRDDFQKYARSRNLVRMQHVLDFAARNVGTKIKYSNVLRDVHSATLRQDIDLLAMARVISKVLHTHASGLPLLADIDETVYKLLFLDVGLMSFICGLRWRSISKLDDIQLINDGAIAEQFVGQHLRDTLADASGRELTYWLREGRSSNAETDFVVGLEGLIVPVEVKAGARGSLRSLHQFVAEKHAPLAVRFDANPPSRQTVATTVQSAGRSSPVEYELISLPLYLVERLADVVTALR